MYRLSVEEFLHLISKGLKNPINVEDVFSETIKVDYLKRIDKLFEKGLHYYLDPRAPETSKEASIFFRKQNFATDNLNRGAVKIVNQFEELKLSLSAIAKLSDLDLKRRFPKFSINEDPKDIAFKIREHLYPSFNRNKREFLKSLIFRFAEYNILVFEFIETWNKGDKANIDGFFLKPNMIVIKRHQSFRREIFTLAHELGHFLLEEEEIEELDYQVIGSRNLTRMEKWCNDFAYFFLVGSYSDTIDNIDPATSENDYNFDIVKKVSDNTHLSQIAIFTRLLFQNKISPPDYNNVKNDFEELYRNQQKERELEKQRLKDLGIKQRGSAAKPIPSPLFTSTIQTAYYEGILNEYEVCKRLKIKPENFEDYIL